MTNTDFQMQSKPTAKSQGDRYEALAFQYLTEHGVRIIESRFRTAWSEIDLIGIEHKTLVFFEVRHRAQDGFGAIESVSVWKQNRIKSSAGLFIESGIAHGCEEIRFDVIAFEGEEMTWLKDGF